MKELITKDGKIILSDTNIETLIGETAHEVYFGLHKLYREVYKEMNLKSDISSIEQGIFDLLNDDRAIDLQEIEEINML